MDKDPVVFSTCRDHDAATHVLFPKVTNFPHPMISIILPL